MTGEEIREEYQNNKEFYNKLLEEGARAKHEKCRIKDKFGKGKHGFDYLKMAEMYHKGEW